MKWQWLALLPFIEEARLTETIMSKVLPKLTKPERQRNAKGVALVFAHRSTALGRAVLKSVERPTELEGDVQLPGQVSRHRPKGSAKFQVADGVAVGSYVECSLHSERVVGVQPGAVAPPAVLKGGRTRGPRPRMMLVDLQAANSAGDRSSYRGGDGRGGRGGDRGRGRGGDRGRGRSRGFGDRGRGRGDRGRGRGNRGRGRGDRGLRGGFRGSDSSSDGAAAAAAASAPDWLLAGLASVSLPPPPSEQLAWANAQLAEVRAADTAKRDGAVQKRSKPDHQPSSDDGSSLFVLDRTGSGGAAGASGEQFYRGHNYSVQTEQPASTESKKKKKKTKRSRSPPRGDAKQQHKKRKVLPLESAGHEAPLKKKVKSTGKEKKRKKKKKKERREAK